MQAKARESSERKPKRGALAVGILYFAGITAIVGWSLPERTSTDRRMEPAMRVPRSAIPDAMDASATPGKVPAGARSKGNCPGCGVIESVRRIDIREEIIGGCAVGDATTARIPGNPVDGGGRIGVPALADTVADVIVGDKGAKKGRVTTRHQIVVRFRDGSRRVFNEETPRTLRVGDRIQVIAGAAGASG